MALACPDELRVWKRCGSQARMPNVPDLGPNLDLTPPVTPTMTAAPPQAQP